MSEHDELVMNELKHIKNTVQEVKDDLKDIKKVCACRVKTCGQIFTNDKVFWKMVWIGALVALGSYSFTASVLAYVIKFYTKG